MHAVVQAFTWRIIALPSAKGSRIVIGSEEDGIALVGLLFVENHLSHHLNAVEEKGVTPLIMNPGMRSHQRVSRKVVTIDAPFAFALG